MHLHLCDDVETGRASVLTEGSGIEAGILGGRTGKRDCEAAHQQVSCSRSETRTKDIGNGNSSLSKSSRSRNDLQHLLPRSSLRRRRRTILNSHRNGERENSRTNADESNPSENGDFVERLNGGEDEYDDGGDDNEDECAGSALRDGVEGDLRSKQSGGGNSDEDCSTKSVLKRTQESE